LPLLMLNEDILPRCQPFLRRIQDCSNWKLVLLNDLNRNHVDAGWK
jgi:hypothetical protein